MDAPAFQHLLSLFPLLTLRQRRVAQRELAAPQAIASLATQMPTCSGCPHCRAYAAQLAPWGGAGDCVVIVASCAYAPAPSSPRPPWPDCASGSVGKITLKPSLRDSLFARPLSVAGSAKIPPSCGATASSPRWPPIRRHGKRGLWKSMKPSSSNRSRECEGYRGQPGGVVAKGEPVVPVPITSR